MDTAGTIFYLLPEAVLVQPSGVSGDKTYNEDEEKRTGCVRFSHAINSIRTQTHSASLLPLPTERG